MARDRTRRPEETADPHEIDISPARRSSPSIEQLAASELERRPTEPRRDEYLAGLQRERAEFSNYRRRTSRGARGDARPRRRGPDPQGARPRRRLRPRDRQPPRRSSAATRWVEGVTAIDRKLRALLESEGVKPVEAEAGKPFDPREHEAIANVPGTGRAEGEIVDVIRRGYKLRDRVLRPALVAVAAAPEPGAADRPTPGAPSQLDHQPPHFASTRPNNQQERHTTWARSSASTSARRTASSRSWRAASRPSSPRPRAAGRCRRSSRSRRPASGSSASWPSARRSPTRPEHDLLDQALHGPSLG